VQISPNTIFGCCAAGDKGNRPAERSAGADHGQEIGAQASDCEARLSEKPGFVSGINTRPREIDRQTVEISPSCQYVVSRLACVTCVDD
jgi:hypothetical protein